MRFKEYLEEKIKTLKIAGFPMELVKQEKSKDTGISYELYKGETKGAVRQYDYDAKQVIDLRTYPTYDKAEKYYKKLIKLK